MKPYVWEAILYIGIITGIRTTVAGTENSTESSITQVASNDTDSLMNNTKRLSGRDLWCYECRESYRDSKDNKHYDASYAPCLNNLSRITIRQCSEEDRYCQVERSEMGRTILTIERGCTRLCMYGCRFNGFGLTTMRCRSCCNTHGCNVGNAADCSDMYFSYRTFWFTVCIFLTELISERIMSN